MQFITLIPNIYSEFFYFNIFINTILHKFKIRITSKICQVYFNNKRTLTEYQKFRAGNLSLEDEPRDSRQPVIDNDQMKVLIERDSLKNTREIPEELSVDHSTVVRHLKLTGKVKKRVAILCGMISEQLLTTSWRLKL